MKFKIWNKKEDRPATVAEINKINRQEQLFFCWVGIAPEEKQKGVVHVHLDSLYEDEFELRNL